MKKPPASPELPEEVVKRYMKRKNYATLKAIEIIGEKQLEKLLKAGIVPVEWKVYQSNTKKRCEALRKIREIVTSPTLINPSGEDLKD